MTMEKAVEARSPLRSQRMVVHREGRGEPVLFVHGITTYSFIWDGLLPYFRDYGVVNVDLAGCGQADMSPEVEYALPAHAERLAAMLDELRIERVHLVAHDVGGGVAQVFAVEYPERLIDLTLINPVGYDYWPVQPISIMRAPILRQLALAALDLGIFTQLIKRGVHRKERVTDELMDRFWAPLRTREGRKAFLRFAKSLDNRYLLEIVPRLERLTVPTLIIRGDGDKYLSDSICVRLARDLPRSRLVRFPDAGHFAQVDVPEDLSRTILTFFEERAGGAEPQRAA